MRFVWSPNHDARRNCAAPDMIVLHYTEMASAAAAVRWLCAPASRVSAHYLVAADGAVVQMVAEERRAWHAGVSSWHGRDDVNSRSIGIELDSPGHAPDPPVFPDAQVDALLDLLAALRARWPVPRRNVVAHSDVAPLRKIDPGERFPWSRLAAEGHALHVPARRDEGPCDAAAVHVALTSCGYAAGCDAGDAPAFLAAVTAFHRRFLPGRVGRPADGATLATARAVAEATAVDRAAFPDPPAAGRTTIRSGGNA